MLKNTKSINVGGVKIGGGSAITVQSMCNTKTTDVEGTLRQIEAMKQAGCDIVRLAVPNEAAAEALRAITARAVMPVVADIHFDYRLAVAAVESGADKIRINPGNIGGDEAVLAVVKACRARHVPIRIGVNGGSLEKPILEKYGKVCPEAMVESAMGHIALLNRFDFDDICVSLKSSDVMTTMAAYRLMHETTEYPLHLGVTEAGTRYMGIIKSAVGIGGLLSEGIGDTLRVSLTDDPVEEVRAGVSILKALELRRGGIRFISCPTCGRTRIDLISIAQEVERRLGGYDCDLTVAVMGCAVNGPGEARHADFGLAGGDGMGVIFSKGEIIGRAAENELVDKLVETIDSYLASK